MRTFRKLCLMAWWLAWAAIYGGAGLFLASVTPMQGVGDHVAVVLFRVVAVCFVGVGALCVFLADQVTRGDA